MTYDNDTLIDVLEDIAKSLRLLSGRESLKDEYEEPLRKEHEAVRALLDAMEAQLPDNVRDKVINDALRRQNDMKVKR